VTNSPEAHSIVDCSMMTRGLGLLAGIVPQDLPESVPFELPPALAG
jgi:hypothetical protein